MTSEHPRVFLIDEIEKAPRDFPNDLLHELDKMDFTVLETRNRSPPTTDKAQRPTRSSSSPRTASAACPSLSCDVASTTTSASMTSW
ncbi:MAG: hypothetical protein H0U97_21105 [Gammaproteobacteria bacterium]|nr:hypothetical protein [Gammaproteobacteria bacterium]